MCHVFAHYGKLSLLQLLVWKHSCGTVCAGFQYFSILHKLKGFPLPWKCEAAYYALYTLLLSTIELA